MSTFVTYHLSSEGFNTRVFERATNTAIAKLSCMEIYQFLNECYFFCFFHEG